MGETIPFECFGCEAVTQVKSKYAGKQIRCPHCDEIQRVPGGERPEDRPKKGAEGRSRKKKKERAREEPKEERREKPAKAKDARVPCPHCGEPVKAQASKCPQCRQWLDRDPDEDEDEVSDEGVEDEDEDGVAGEARAARSKGGIPGVVKVLVLVSVGVVVLGIGCFVATGPSRARNEARWHTASCANKLRGVALSGVMFADKRRTFPDGGSWPICMGQLMTSGLLDEEPACEAAAGASYAGFIAPWPNNARSTTMLAWDAEPRHATADGQPARNVVFIDATVQLMPEEEFAERLKKHQAAAAKLREKAGN